VRRLKGKGYTRTFRPVQLQVYRMRREQGGGDDEDEDDGM